MPSMTELTAHPVTGVTAFTLFRQLESGITVEVDARQFDDNSDVLVLHNYLRAPNGERLLLSKGGANPETFWQDMSENLAILSHYAEKYYAKE
jgi:hypothetical protein